jgi:hypothetical protein
MRNPEKKTQKDYSYDTLMSRVMKNPNPEEKDWVRLKYEDKMDWMNIHGKIPRF